MADRKTSRSLSAQESHLDDAMEGIFHPEKQSSIPEHGHGREDKEGQGYFRSASFDLGAYGHPLEDQDRRDHEETTRRTSIHDTDKLTSGHSAPDFAHAHQPLKKLIHSSGHSVKKKSRKVSDKAEILEGIQEKEGQDNPDPTILEEEEKMEEGSKLPWRQAGDEEGTLAMAPSEIARDAADVGGEVDDKERDIKRGGSVLFEIGGGGEDGEEEPSEHRKKHKKSSHHHPHHHKEHFNDRYRVGSDLSFTRQ